MAERIQPGFYWVRHRDDRAAEPWMVGKVDDRGELYMTGWECGEPVGEFTIGPRIEPPDAAPAEGGAIPPDLRELLLANLARCDRSPFMTHEAQALAEWARGRLRGGDGLDAAVVLHPAAAYGHPPVTPTDRGTVAIGALPAGADLSPAKAREWAEALLLCASVAADLTPPG